MPFNLPICFRSFNYLIQALIHIILRQVDCSLPRRSSRHKTNHIFLIPLHFLVAVAVGWKRLLRYDHLLTSDPPI